VGVTLPLTLEASPATTSYGQGVVVTAKVTPGNIPSGFSAPSGTVNFLENGFTLASGTLVSNNTTVTLTGLAAGKHNIVAVYQGDGVWPTATNSITITISLSSTVTTLTPSLDSSGHAVLTAAVAPVSPATGAPTGSVQFVDLASKGVIGTANLSSGGAALTIPAGAANHALAASYSGDSNFKASTSATLPVVVSAVDMTMPAFAPDSIASIFGVPGMSGDTSASLPLPPSLGGVTGTITDSSGQTNPVALYGAFASAQQINFVFPSSVAAGPAILKIALPGGDTEAAILMMAPSWPGIFTANQSGSGIFAGQVIHVHADGTQTITDSTTINAQNQFSPNPVSLTPASDQVFLTLYGTGIRHGRSVTATVNGVTVTAAFAAQPQYPGLDQINLQLPASLAGAGPVNIVISVDGNAANTVTTLIQ
jgi:uncharacterized protein (TIGR03437 family)